MTMRTLKWIALVTMTIDHIGAFLIPTGTLNLVFRAIGRLAYPLFALMAAEAFAHTHDRTSYLIRLVVMAAASEAVMGIFWIATGVNLLLQADVFLPLAFGFAALWLVSRRRWYLTLAVVPLLVLAEATHISYGAMGILLIVLFGMVPGFSLRVLGFVLLSLLFIDWPLPAALGFANGMSIHVYEQWYQWFALAALVPIGLYDGRRGAYSKWFFYVYYPAHLAVLAALAAFLG